jgi:hypothetical protein
VELVTSTSAIKSLDAPILVTTSPTGTSSVGAIRFRSVEQSTDGDIYIGVSGTNFSTAPVSKAEVNFNGARVTNGVSAGDCDGDWNRGTKEAPASNDITVRWNKANDNLEVTFKSATVDCTFTQPNHTSEVANVRFGGSSAFASAALLNVNSLQINPRTSNTETVFEAADLVLDGTHTLGSFNGTVTNLPTWVTSYDFDADGGFTLSGALRFGRTGSTACGVEACTLNLSLGTTTVVRSAYAAATDSVFVALTPAPATATPTITASTYDASTLPTAYRPFVLTGARLLSVSASNAGPANSLGYLVCIKGSTAPNRLWNFNGTEWVDITIDEFSWNGRVCGYVDGLTRLAIAPPKSATTTTLASSANPSLVNDEIVLTAAASTTSGTLSGQLQIFSYGTSDSTEVKSCAVGDACTFNTTPLAASTTTYRAFYSGDEAFLASKSAELTQKVAKLNQTINVSQAAPGSALVGATFNVAATATSNLPVSISTSGACSASGATITANSAGDCTVSYAQAGNGNFDAAPGVSSTTTVTAPLSSVYNVTGFFAPVDMSPVVNGAKAGQTIPLKFRVLTETGAPYLGLVVGDVAVTSVRTAGTTGSTDAIEFYTGGSGLQNLGDGYYQFNWKTDKLWASSARTLSLTLTKTGISFGSATTAKFKFTK